MTILELEIMFYLWSTDRSRCLELLQKMITGKREDPMHSCSISIIFNNMGLYVLHGISREHNYFEIALKNLGKELGMT